MKTLDAQFWLKLSKLTEAHERGDFTGRELRQRIAELGQDYGLTTGEMIRRQLLDTAENVNLHQLDERKKIKELKGEKP